jgi:hypothetical protein
VGPLNKYKNVSGSYPIRGDRFWVLDHSPTGEIGVSERRAKKYLHQESEVKRKDFGYSV